MILCRSILKCVSQLDDISTTSEYKWYFNFFLNLVLLILGNFEIDQYVELLKSSFLNYGSKNNYWQYAIESLIPLRIHFRDYYLKKYGIHIKNEDRFYQYIWMELPSKHILQKTVNAEKFRHEKLSKNVINYQLTTIIVYWFNPDFTITAW